MTSMTLLTERDTVSLPNPSNAATSPAASDVYRFRSGRRIASGLGAVYWLLLNFDDHWLTAEVSGSPLTIQTAAEPGHTQAEWKATLDQQLDEIANLTHGWDTYTAEPIEPGRLNDARAFLNRLARPGLPAPAAVPTINRTVQFEWHTRRVDAEVEILEDGVYHVFVQPRGGESSEDQMSLDAAVTRLEDALSPKRPGGGD